MAELLVLMKSQWSGDTYTKQQLKIDNDKTIPENEKVPRKEVLADKYKLRYEKGDIVGIAADGHEWGRLETAPIYCVIKFAGIPVDDMKQYVAPQYNAGWDVIRSREWQFLIDTLPADAIAKTGAGELTLDKDITWAVLKDSLYSHKLGRTELRTVIRV